MKVAVCIAGARGTNAHRICWYTGTSDAQVEKAIRLQLQIPHDVDFLLRDADDDVVPASSTLPTGHYYTLVLPQGLEYEDLTLTSNDETEGAIFRTMSLSSSNDDNDMSVITHDQETASLTSSSKGKRKRREQHHLNIATTSSQPGGDHGCSIRTSITQKKLTPPRSIAPIIAQFVETFTQSIANEDNISFIPNAGRFALYALYCKIVPNTKFHPKREDVFYKMTSMYGKVDRQRVVRFYKCFAQDKERIEILQYKPQGKGVLLRRYQDVGSAKEVLKSAPFVSWLQLDPNEVMALYVRFIHSFTPIAKSDFKAQKHHFVQL